jgi:apolipoprotein N-acyltransferase
MDDRPGCLGGLLRLTIIAAAFNWLQKQFGVGRGASCSGCGCGVILLLIFIVLVCGTCAGTNWFDFSF